MNNKKGRKNIGNLNVRNINIQLAGFIGVDSGQMALIDPCYINDKEVTYEKMCKISLSKKGFGIFNNKVGASLGFVTQTYDGDGMYPVFVETYKGKVTSVLIQFVDPKDLEEEINEDKK